MQVETPRMASSITVNAQIMEGNIHPNIQEAEEDVDKNTFNEGENVMEEQSGVNNEANGLTQFSDSFLITNTPYGSCHDGLYFYSIWTPFYYNYPTGLQNYTNSFNNFYYPVNDIPIAMVPQVYTQCSPVQEFHYYVVIDFEATCDKNYIPEPQEIIEFPSVIVNGMTGQLEASFRTYIRPTCHQNLTEFCKELTGIQQIEVDQGVTLSEALIMHDKWLQDMGIKDKSFAIVTWSNWDCKVILESECRVKNIHKPYYFNRWINLKFSFQEIFGGIRCNLERAVYLAGLRWEGRAHCGLDDARNTARLLSTLILRGFKFSITNSLVRSANDTLININRSISSSSTGTSEKKNSTDGRIKRAHTYCFCGVRCNRCMVRKWGPNKGRFFDGCGNWTVERGSVCNYFKWVSN